MHWMQSLHRATSGHDVVAPEKRGRFWELARIIRTTEDADEFCASCKELVTSFSRSFNWLKWWLQPSISSMIFNHRSSMNPALRNHPSRTANAVESYHRDLYRNIPSERPGLALGIRHALNYIATAEEKLRIYETHGIVPTYSKSPRKPATKKFRGKKYVNDGRAPDLASQLVAIVASVNDDLNLSSRRKTSATMLKLKS